MFWNWEMHAWNGWCDFQISDEKAQAKAAKYDFKPRYYSIVGALLDAAAKADTEEEPVGFMSC